MSAVLELVLGVSLLWLAYAYLGYPLLLFLFAHRPGQRAAAGGGFEPRVTVITVAFNEQRVIGETITNKLTADYAPDKLDMIVVDSWDQNRNVFFISICG